MMIFLRSKIFLIMVVSFLVFLGSYVFLKHIKEVSNYKENYIEKYEKCNKNLLSNEICQFYKKPYKNRDSLSTFGYVTLAYDEMSILQILAPLLIMIVSITNFHKLLWKGFIKNGVTRVGYDVVLFKSYLKSLSSAFIMPVFLLILFLISCFVSGNFDYDNGIKQYGFNAFGEGNYQNWLIFIFVYILNFFMHSVFWINIGIFNCKHNKNPFVAIIISYIEYVMIFIIFDVLFAGALFSNSSFSYYFSLTNIWAYSGVSLIGITLSSFFLLFISSLVIFLTFKNKEKVLEGII